MRLTIIGVLFSLSAVLASGQDLGSSNKLFGGKKTGSTPSKPKTLKKAVARAKSSPSKPKPVAKKEATPPKAIKTARPSTQSTAAAKPKFTEFNEAKPKKVEITIGQPKDLPVPTGKAADDLFEKLIANGNSARDDRNYSSAETAYKRAKSVKPKDSRAV